MELCVCMGQNKVSFIFRGNYVLCIGMKSVRIEMGLYCGGPVLGV